MKEGQKQIYYLAGEFLGISRFVGLVVIVHVFLLFVCMRKGQTYYLAGEFELVASCYVHVLCMEEGQKQIYYLAGEFEFEYEFAALLFACCSARE